MDIICIDNPNLQSLIPYLKRRYVTYGLSKQADIRATDIRIEGFKTICRVMYKDSELGELTMTISGIHNIVNGLAACAVGIELDIPFEKIAEALSSFTGIQRRLEVKWDGHIKLIDDYGHHPTEIRATLLSLRNMCKGRIIVIFQPHRYTRTKALMEEFVTSFNEADVLLVTEIYPASEEPIEGVSGAVLAERIKTSGHKSVIYCSTKEDVVERVLEIASHGDTVVVLGAGDINKICDVLIKRWTGKE